MAEILSDFIQNIIEIRIKLIYKNEVTLAIRVLIHVELGRHLTSGLPSV